ncbi:hypothetical protein CC78DRAFT_621434 [Lojkania enalia]|uniref:Uncharacterized protein n=1 Tax=Lojkania enalia TaxID=147567 RepID=A0A9P4N524_9PLEO|nr:hypothetical protein CC78DRAFT_621434 [Didymosphaeria enalia]
MQEPQSLSSAPCFLRAHILSLDISSPLPYELQNGYCAPEKSPAIVLFTIRACIRICRRKVLKPHASLFVDLTQGLSSIFKGFETFELPVHDQLDGMATVQRQSKGQSCYQLESWRNFPFANGRRNVGQISKMCCWSSSRPELQALPSNTTQ